MSKIQITPFFHEPTFTVTYVVTDRATNSCAIIDPVLDYDAAAGQISHEFADKVVSYVDKNGLTLEWILETHAHADHLTAAPYIKEKLGGLIGVGDHIRRVQSTFKAIYNLESTFLTDGSQFDQLFVDGEVITLGHLDVEVLHTPGHTPACVSYYIEDAVFVGDTLFMPDYGTARCDFPGGDARVLYQSIQKVLALPPETRIFLCHDYKAPDRDEYQHMTTVAEQRQANVHVHDGVSEEEFVKMRTERDATLDMPRLILPSVQVNMRAGHMPPAEDNGQVYLKVPVNLF